MVFSSLNRGMIIESFEKEAFGSTRWEYLIMAEVMKKEKKLVDNGNIATN